MNVSVPKRNKLHLFQRVFCNFVGISGLMRLFIRYVDAFVLINARDKQRIREWILREPLCFEHCVKYDAWPVDRNMIEHSIDNHEINFTALCMICTTGT